jgi:hypothetical protein
MNAQVGELRPSQLLHTYGIGAVIDLPHLSVMVMGLDDWNQEYCRPISEERLLAAVRGRMGAQVERLVTPPMTEEERVQPIFGEASVGVPVAPFPRYLRCPACNLLAPIRSGLFKLKTNPYRPDRARYVHTNCNRLTEPTALPARFLLACEGGHLDDFPWHEYVKHKSPACTGHLYMEEQGATGEAADVRVRCGQCGASRPMAQAFMEEAYKHLPRCRGRRPQLRDYQEGGCDLPPRTILLGASNSWFGVSMSALYVPPTAQDRLARLVEDHWNLLRNTTDFQVEQAGVPSRWERWLSDVLMVRRLREVTALVGFTRIGSPRDYSALCELPGERHAPLCRRPPTFVPASEVRGEGLFLRFEEETLTCWCEQPKTQVAFEKAHRAWRQRRKIEPAEGGFPGLRYLVLHTFAHALMRQLSIECGYAAASLRERIYAREAGDEGPAMAGVLIYTSASDSEGTLGGLVHLGKPEELVHHLRKALEDLRLCSSDPLCADHEPEPDGTSLHGAACHACLFAPETSCERGNRYLDRTLLVPTVRGLGGSFFEGLIAR